MWFPLEPADGDFVARAPHRFEHMAILAAPPERVFDVLADGAKWASWFQDLVSYEWTSPPPHGAGSTRTLVLEAVTVQERILVSDAPTASAGARGRIVYAMERSTLPLARRYVGDMSLEPHGHGETRFHWVAAYEPTLFFRAIHPVGRRLFDKTFRDSMRRLAELFGASPVLPSHGAWRGR